MKKIDLLAKFSKLKLDDKKLFAVILFCLIIIYLDFAFLIQMQFRAVKDLNPKIKKLKIDLSELSGKLNTAQDLKNIQTDIRHKFFSKAKKIPSEDEITSLLESVSDLANKRNIRITQMRPYKESQGKQEKALAAQKFTAYYINLDLSCGYHSLGQFLNDLENAQILFAVQDLKIVSGDTDYLKQNVNLLLRTYVKR